LKAQNISFPRCAADEYVKYSEKLDSSFKIESNHIEENYQKYVRLNNSKSNNKNAAVIYTLPIVVHVIHQNGIENISDDQIIQGIEDLNEGFRNLIMWE